MNVYFSFGGARLGSLMFNLDEILMPRRLSTPTGKKQKNKIKLEKKTLLRSPPLLYIYIYLI
jgi:hypothetical protein